VLLPPRCLRARNEKARRWAAGFSGKQNVHRTSGGRSDFVDDLVGETVGDGFLRVEVEVAVGVVVDAFERWPSIGEDLV